MNHIDGSEPPEVTDMLVATGYDRHRTPNQVSLPGPPTPPVAAPLRPAVPATFSDGSLRSLRNGWIGGTPPLPEALLRAAVGDLDVIERLSQQAHQARIPTWLCSYCGKTWPCEPAQGDLLLDLGWIKVAIYCAALMERATKDLSPCTPKELWQRFLEWTESSEDARNLLLKQIT